MVTPVQRNLNWQKQFRLIPSHFPPIQLFEDILEPEELEIAYYLESLTNDRLKAEVGNLSLVAKHDYISGPGASVVMACFTHIGNPSRFSDGTFGLYYAASTIETAIAETKFHRERFLRATNEPSCEITMRCYIGQINKPMHDIRGEMFQHLHDPDLNSYTVSQPFGHKMRTMDSWGLVYRSVRHSGGECIAAFRANAISRPVQGAHYRYRWNGSAITDIFKVTEHRAFC